MTRARIVVAIDGPAGAGKSTAARRLAQRLGFVLVDTGALYRGVALAAKERGVSWTDGAALGALASTLALHFETGDDGAPHLFIDGDDRARDIRTQEIAQGASDVSKLPEVRAALLGLQRRLGADGGVVLEGRDIGTVVFPDAELKVFLTASERVRGKRRYDELVGKGVAADLEQVIAEVRARDLQDSSRDVAPLKPADDAVILDSSDLDLDAVVARIAALAATRR